MAEFDTFIKTTFEELPMEIEMEGVLRDLTAGRQKYKCLRARFILSKDPNKYPDRLWIRLEKGQVVTTPCSVKVLEVLPPVEA